MSFFSNSNLNKRIKRGGGGRSQSLLEVSARPETERRLQSKRRIGTTLRVAAWVLMVVGTLFGGRFLYKRYVAENPTYALSEIRVSTDGLLTRAQVLEITELAEGKNIFWVNLDKAREALKQLPQVERVEIRRVLPDRVDVRITERQPIAWVADSVEADGSPSGLAYLVDTRGYVMKTRKFLPEHKALPVLLGVVMEDVAPGQKLPSPEALAALELTRLTNSDLRWQPRTIDVSKGYCMVVTDLRKAKVTFGFDEIPEQLGRLRQIIDFVEPTQREFQSVNLMLERNVPVVFAPMPAPLPDPKPGGKNKTASKTGTAPETAAPVSLVSAPLSGGVAGGVVSSTPVDLDLKRALTAAQPPPFQKPDEQKVAVAPIAPAPAPEPTPVRDASSKQRESEPPQKPLRKTPAPSADEDSKPERQSAPPPRVLAVAKNDSRDAEKSPSPAQAKSAEKTPEKTPEKKSSKAPSQNHTPSSQPERQSLSPSEALRRLFNPHG